MVQSLEPPVRRKGNKSNIVRADRDQFRVIQSPSGGHIGAYFLPTEAVRAELRPLPLVVGEYTTVLAPLPTYPDGVNSELPR